MKVLLVDDHPLILSALKNIIQTLDPGIPVLSAENPQDAFALLATDPGVELLLLDLNLGLGVDGFAVLADLRERYPALRYGCPPLEYLDARRITAPLLGHFATQDGAFPIATIDALEVSLRGADVGFTFHRYLAQHGFANETAVGPHRIAITQYDGAWAQIAWDRTLRLFKEKLG